MRGTGRPIPQTLSVEVKVPVYSSICMIKYRYSTLHMDSIYDIYNTNGIT